MTMTPAELELSPEAAARLDDYLRQVRAALAGAADVNPDEIEADIREHVENELRKAPRPVALSALEAVLTRLGPPLQWGATDNPSLLRRTAHAVRERMRGARAVAVEQAKRARFTLWNGPDDWRLPYLSFGIFAVGVLTFFIFPLALMVSYILSRAGLAVAKEKGITLGLGRKWLLYPPVVIVSIALLIPVVAWPFVLGALAHDEVARAAYRVRAFDAPEGNWMYVPEWSALQVRRDWKQRVASQVEEDRKLLALVPVTRDWAPTLAGLFVGFGAFAMWWTVLGFVSACFPNVVRAVFVPLCDRFEPRHGWWLAVPCLAASVCWCVAAYEIVSGAGLM